jgi:predicted MFS family arabinose efflux permease
MIALIVLGTAYLFSQFFRTFLAIVAEDLSRDLALNAAQLGDLSAIWFGAFALAQLPIGLALDRIGPRRTVSGAMAFAVIGAFLFAAAQSFSVALVAMALIGIGCAPILMGIMYMIGRVYPPRLFGTIGAAMVGISSLGNILGATPLALAVATYGWRASFAGIAAAVALVTAAVVLFLRDPPPAEHPSGPSSLWGGFVEILRLPGFVALLPLIGASYAVVIAERSLWIGPYLRFVHALEPIDRANAAFVMAIAMVIGAFAYGPAERLFGAKRTAIVGTIVTILAFAALPLVPVGSTLAATALMSLAGGFGITYSVLLAHGRSFFPDRLLGRGVTLMNFFFIGGAAVVQLVSGRFVASAGAAGSTAEATYAALHLGFALLLAVTLAVYLRAPAHPVKPS